jgi:ribosomal protein S18 acetylase RimI-like enzyme
MEILDLRQLRSRDLEPLLTEEQRAWESRLEWDYSNTASLILRFLEARALTGYAALDEGRVVGFGFFIYEDRKGLIGDAFVSESYRDGVTEVRLMTHIIETLVASPGIRRIEAQLMNFGGDAVLEWLAAQEFKSHRRRFMGLALANLQQFPMLPADIQIAPWNARWIPEAGRLITRAYQGHVDSEISDQYRSQSGAMRFLDNIVRYPGCGVFYPAGSFLAFRTGSASPCGMVLSSVVQDRVAHITQLCVEPELQDAGIGSALMQRALTTLREQGFRAVTLSVTDTNQRAVCFYERLRFATLHEFHAFSWDAAETGVFFPGQRVGTSKG